MRLKFWERSELKLVSRINPDSDSVSGFLSLAKSR